MSYTMHLKVKKKSPSNDVKQAHKVCDRLHKIVSQQKYVLLDLKFFQEFIDHCSINKNLK